MTKEEFKPVFIKLCDYYDKKVTAELLDTYYTMLKELTILEFRKKCKELIKKDTYMPKVSEFHIYDKDGIRMEGIRVRSKQYDDMTDADWEKLYTVGGREDL